MVLTEALAKANRSVSKAVDFYSKAQNLYSEQLTVLTRRFLAPRGSTSGSATRCRRPCRAELSPARLRSLGVNRRPGVVGGSARHGAPADAMARRGRCSGCYCDTPPERQSRKRGGWRCLRRGCSTDLAGDAARKASRIEDAFGRPHYVAHEYCGKKRKAKFAPLDEAGRWRRCARPRRREYARTAARIPAVSFRALG